MFKVTVIYNHPTDPEAFEKYYAETHTPIALKIKNMVRFELTKFIETPDGKPEYYRMAELCFATAEDMQASMGSPEGQAAAGDMANFATGGAKVLIGMYQAANTL